MTVVFALVGGDNLADLQAGADAAAAQYQQLLGVALPLGTADATLYPNPSADGRFTLTPTGRAGTIDVFDARGARVLRQGGPGAAATVLDLRSQPAGLYVVRFAPASGGPAQTWRAVRQ